MVTRGFKLEVGSVLNDVVFGIGAFGGIETLHSIRSTCKQWRLSIDSVEPSSELWQRLACSLADVSPASGTDVSQVSDGMLLAPSLTWKDECYALAHHPAKMPWALGSLPPAIVMRLLKWFEVVAEVIIIDSRMAFNTVFDGNCRSQASLIIYTACSQKPPHNMQCAVYSWWLGAAFKIVGIIRARMAHSLADVQKTARHSFQSFVKLMASVVLPYLDRFYVRRHEVLGDVAASLPTVREIGRRAVEQLGLPFDSPLPSRMASPCSDVPLNPDGLVDEVTLHQRQRIECHRRDLERFDEILTQAVGVVTADEN